MQTQFLAQCISSANAANASGRYNVAISLCQQALQLAPDLPEAWYNLGLAFRGRGQIQEATNALLKTAALAHNNPDAQNSISLQFIEIGAYPEAERCLQQSLKLVPNYAFAYSNLGKLREKQKRLDDAEAAFRKAIELQPDLGPAYTNLGGILNAQKKYEAAEVTTRRAIELDPQAAEAWTTLGSALYGLKRYEAAEAAARKAIEFNPQAAAAWTTLGSALYGLKRYEATEAATRKAIELDPQAAEAWSNLSSALYGLKRYEAAETAARKAIEFDPQTAAAWTNLGAALYGLKRYNATEAATRRAIELDPQAAQAWTNLGAALSGLKRHEEAVDCFNNSLKFNANAEFMLGEMLQSKLHICDWGSFDINLAQLTQRIELGEKTSSPFTLLALTTDLAVQRKAAEIYAADMFPQQLDLAPIPRRARTDKIRIGYFSADFSNHPVSILMAEVFELHDRTRFDLIGFAFGKDCQDEMRQRVSAAFDQFIDVREKSDQQVAELSRAMRIDIAIDLGGFTENCRTGIFAMRAAPIQVSHIGYLGTMGAPYIDYLLADEVIIPKKHQQYFSEKIAYLPSYQPNDSKRRISDRVFTREELGLPSTGFVFCCFNNNFKITPPTFDGWMRILKQVADSTLFLYADSDRAAANLKKEAECRGIDSSRLVFGKRLPPPDYIARYRVADLFLDTFPYNAGTTASDALWAGLPVLTCMGESFASRVAASLLSAIGLSELITTTQEDYEALAIEMATNPDQLVQVKQKLERNRLTTALFDSALFTKHIEATYTTMYERYQGELQPGHITTKR